MDPIKETVEIICGQPHAAFERRLKQDIIDSIGRIKPQIVQDIQFEKDVMSGSIFSTLSAPLQGIAIQKLEGTLAYYNRVGWAQSFLTEPLGTCVPSDAIDQLTQRYHAKSLHDLAYVHPKHFEKMLTKAGAANLWEALKRFSAKAAEKIQT